MNGLLAAFMVPHPPMIVPAVGRGSEAQIEKTIGAYEKVADEIAKIEPETILITSPHTVMYADYFHISPGSGAKGSFSDFRASQIRFEETYDEELVRLIENMAEEQGISAGTLGERDKKLDHGCMVPLWFVEQKYKDFKLVRIGLSGLSLAEHYRFGMLLKEALQISKRKAVLIASGDLSHKLQDYGPYGFAKEGPEYDAKIMDVCGRAAFGELFDFSDSFCEKAAECGHRSFTIMAGMLDGQDVEAKALSHEDVTGVGYGICTFYPKGENQERKFLDRYLKEMKEKTEKEREKEDAYVRLARASLEHYIRHGSKLDLPEDLPEEMINKKAGVFVSIHEHGRLRGCIGTISPVTDCVAREILDNAISASTRDPRFDPIKEEELPWLEIHVDVLGEAEDIASEEELDVKRYGVIVSKGFKRGLLLPDLDGVDTVRQQVDIACQKAGIRPGESVKLQRFEVIRHE